MRQDKKYSIRWKQVLLFIILLSITIFLGNLNKTESKHQSTMEQMGQNAGY